MAPLKDKQGQLLKGTLSLLLLAILETEPAHGYAAIRELERRSHGAFDLAEGTVYPALYRLEKQGLLESRRAAVDGRERRVYSLTAKGQVALGEDVKAWHNFAQGLSAVLERASVGRMQLELGSPTTQASDESEDTFKRASSDTSGDKASLVEVVLGPQSSDPEMKDSLADAISRLPEREKLVVALNYYENLTLREIGEVLGVTESRVSQLHTKAVLRLKSRLQGDSLGEGD